ncbi:hypothetical protein F441_09534 [Phytophthora nicotianae CJ01A1]|uniref:EF-hand domain-containing protein n=6 Tax=Phytophthora nicotianae TaxID=4792 RepID=V9F5F0_PHYNI|nr:hypothetical protein F443_09602 [Phytophthora nicotianae P1569]ETL39326.1 hypothetical protein L916_09301 [Phytophthora nicotianae]ETL92442.1 hypothetical protein L917_09234 [Phytophthora nicotianae]ETM45750.1 hypothetical protein L914_09259 [Phytophthora nicotianae]ETP15791.1 hypothetical protein F441_09534 [Phytophthora nicotianae CJ01A1]
MGSLLAKYGLGTKLSQEKAFNRALHLNGAILQTLKGLGLDHKHLYALHQIFSAMDKDKSGEINMLEFFDYIDLTRSRFSEKAFSVMDRNGSGEVDFIEFVLAVWNYCTFNHASLVRFAFDLYDVDGSGEIEHDEVVRCVREVWGSAWETSPNAQKIVEKLDTIMENTANNRLTANLFQEFAVRHPMLLFPAFELQMEIQRKVLGKRFWSRAAEKRGSINVTALNWDHVKEVTLISRKTSSKLLTSMEEDLNTELQTKTSSNWYGRGSGFRPFSHRSKRTHASGSVNTSDSGEEAPDKGAIKLPELKRTTTPARREIRRQSAPAVTCTTRRTSHVMDPNVVKVASPKHGSQDLTHQTNLPGAVS